MGSLEVPLQQEMNDSGYVQEEAHIMECVPPPSINLLDLSDDVLLYILRYCSPRDLKALGFTCTRLGSLILDRTLWQRVDGRDTPSGKHRVKWLLTHGLSAHTNALLLSGYAQQAKGCLGFMCGTKIDPEVFGTDMNGIELPVTEEPTDGSGARMFRLSTQALPRYGGGFPFWPEQPPQTPQASQTTQASQTPQASQTSQAQTKPSKQSKPEATSKKCPGPQVTLTAAALKRLACLCTNLTELALDYCVIDCATTNISMFPWSLKKLSLRGTKCFNLERSFLFKIQDRLIHLEELDVSCCDWVEPACMLPLSKVEKLTTLIMQQCPKLTEFVAYASLATRYGFKTLKVLDLRGSPVGDSEVSALGWVPRLEELYLSPATSLPRHADHAHFSHEPLPSFTELEPWEEDEPEFFKAKYVSEEWLKEEGPNVPQARSTNCTPIESAALASCILLERMFAEPVVADEYCRMNGDRRPNDLPQGQQANQADAQANNQPNAQADAQANNQLNAQANIQANDPPNIQANNQPNAQANIQADNQPNIQANNQANAQANIQADNQPNIQANNQPSAQVNVQANPTRIQANVMIIQPNAPADAQANNQPNAQANVPANPTSIHANVIIQPNAPADAQANNQPNAQANIQANNQPSAQANVQAIPASIHANVIIQPNVQGDAQNNPGQPAANPLAQNCVNFRACPQWRYNISNILRQLPNMFPERRNDGEGNDGGGGCNGSGCINGRDGSGCLRYDDHSGIRILIGGGFKRRSESTEQEAGTSKRQKTEPCATKASRKYFDDGGSKEGENEAETEDKEVEENCKDSNAEDATKEADKESDSKETTNKASDDKQDTVGENDDNEVAKKDGVEKDNTKAGNNQMDVDQDSDGDDDDNKPDPKPAAQIPVNQGASTSRTVQASVQFFRPSTSNQNATEANEDKKGYVQFRRQAPPIGEHQNNNDNDEPNLNRNENRQEAGPSNRQDRPEQDPRHRVVYVNVGSRRHFMYHISMPVPLEPVDLRTNSLQLPIPDLNLIYASQIAPRLEYTALVTDSAIRRFGRADGENINYVQIGPYGPVPAPHDDPRARPDRSNLRILSVTGFRHITDVSLTHLATAAPRLEFLDLTGTRVTEMGVEHFRTCRPTCRVVYGQPDTKEPGDSDNRNP